VFPAGFRGRVSGQGIWESSLKAGSFLLRELRILYLFRATVEIHRVDFTGNNQFEFVKYLCAHVCHILSCMYVIFLSAALCSAVATTNC